MKIQKILTKQSFSGIGSATLENGEYKGRRIDRQRQWNKVFGFNKFIIVINGRLWEFSIWIQYNIIKNIQKH